MPVFRKLITVVSAGVLGLFAIYVVSTPFLREPPAPVVNVTIEPQPRPETTDATSEPAADATSETTEPPFDAIEPSSETADETTSGAYQTGERTGEQLNHLWQETKDFGRGLWSTLTEKEQ